MMVSYPTFQTSHRRENFENNIIDFEYLSALLPEKEKTLLFLVNDDQIKFQDKDGNDGTCVFFHLFLLLSVLLGCVVSHMLYSLRMSRLQVDYDLEKDDHNRKENTIHVQHK